MLYENTVHKAQECDRETMDFLRGFAQYNNYVYEVQVMRKGNEREYDITVVCPEYKWQQIMQEV